MQHTKKFLSTALLIFALFFSGVIAMNPTTASAATQRDASTEFLNVNVTAVTSKSNSNYGLTDITAYGNSSNWLYSYSSTLELSRVYNGKNYVVFSKKIGSYYSYTNYLPKGDYCLIVYSTRHNKWTGSNATVHSSTAWVMN